MSVRFATLAALLCVAAPIGAQIPGPPFTAAGTAGAYLEHVFSGIMSDCGLPHLREQKKKNTEDKSSVPTLVAQVVAMNEGVVIRQNESIARVFYYISPSATVSDDAHDAVRYLVANMEEEPIGMLAPGFTRVAHTHNCSSVISAATSAGLNVPVADLKAALSADYSGKKQTALVVIAGTFFSPLSQMLNGGNALDRSAAELMFWEWYTRNPGLANSPQQYMQQFDGVTIYQLSETRRDANGEVSLEAAANAIVGNVRGTIKAAVLNKEGTEVRAFSTAFYQPAGGPRVKFAQVPSPAEIAADIAKLRPVVRVPNSIVLQGGSHQETVQLATIPASLCSMPQWRTDAAGGSGTLTITGARPMPGATGCELDVSYVPDPAIFTGAAHDLALQYKVLSTTAVAGKSLEFAVGPVNLTTSTSPIVLAVPFNTMWSTEQTVNGGNTTTTLRWRAGFVIDDRQNAVDATKQVTAHDVAVVCGQEAVKIQFDPKITLSNLTGALALSYPVNAADDLDVGAVTAPRRCTVSAALDIPLAGGGTAVRGLPLAEILVPSQKPKIAALNQTAPNANAVKQ